MPLSVLVAKSDAYDCESIASFLRSRYSVETAKNARCALRAVQDDALKCGLVITSSVGFVQQVRAIEAPVDVVLVNSTRFNRPRPPHLVMPGVVAFDRPVTAQSLRRAIDLVLEYGMKAPKVA